MSTGWIELTAGPARAAWRAGLGWALAFVFIIVSTVAFWPAFRLSPGLSGGLTELLDQLPQGMLQAFGLRDFDSAAGYLRGGLYAIVVPLMFAAAGVMFASGATATEEDSGRLELLLAQPVTRQALFAGRALAVLGWLLGLVVVTAVSQFASDAAFDLEIGADRLLAAIVLCALLGTFHGGLALAVAGLSARPSAVLAIGLGAALAGYVVAALFPLSADLEPWRRISPWDWALGGDPLVNGAEPWRYGVLALTSVSLGAFGVIAFTRRDVRSA
ncbi:MAG TPA: ABC transporter permease subunit [Candidatus Limnocylindrales bacterium]